MLRIVEDIDDRSMFDDTPALHHRNGVGELAYQCQIMGDENIGQAELRLQREQHIDDVCPTLTSSAEVGSSSTITSGRRTSAL